MQKTFTNLVAAATVASTLAGCAGSYRAIQPERITSYQSTSGKGVPVEFSYRYGALLTHGPNKKYVKKNVSAGISW
ncbi:hypothetical protein LRS06_04880 [Hymenobacter sp. J193]|uniref:hypothetical protein n=1 Tax=Hymenobacter sp. J193 TaxID=2898429 RepID=UPI00215129D7|nr:hypothetical protein [Hymenobacter sp. J193]MCR5887121.1 hypothetical protein [Hymenobacter sp. J193]